MTGDWMRHWRTIAGVERLTARFAGRGYDRHRHDTYTVCVTRGGVQRFDYRGATREALAGDVVVLHPDEPHDGRAADAAGFAYAGLQVPPAAIAEAMRVVAGRAVPLPFAGDPVTRNPVLAGAVAAAFAADDEPLAMDAIVLRLAEGLAREDAACRSGSPRLRVDRRAVMRARDLLDAAAPATVRGDALEAASGLSRFALARQFRAAFGTSPHRYLVLRRLDRARGLLQAGVPPADAAVASGFADQAHLTRRFRAAYGVTPGRFAALDRAGRHATSPSSV